MCVCLCMHPIFTFSIGLFLFFDPHLIRFIRHTVLYDMTLSCDLI